MQTRYKFTGEQPSRDEILTKPLSNFIDITPRYRYALKICSKPEKYLFIGEHLWGLLLYVKRILKELNSKKLAFTVVRRN